MSLSEWLLDPLQWEFMQRAVIAAVLVGAVSGVIGSFVVVRGMSFFGDALAHAVLPGVAVAYIYTGTGAASIPILSSIADENVRLFVGGLVAGVGSALVIGWLTRDDRLKEDTAIGIVFVAMFALGIAIISHDPRAYGRDLSHILFGHILEIRDTHLYIMAGCGVFVIGTIALLYKELVIISFDRNLARTLRLPSERLRLLILVLIAVTIIASLQIVGISLMLAMLIAPAATARLVTQRMHHMIFVATLLGIVGGVVGIFVAYHQEIAPGPAIVLTVTAIFGIVLAGTRIRDRLLQTA
jgi:ABC-type Mn2+/Zn2+ transport system permease subunit